MLEEKTEPDPTFEAMPLVDLLTEGALASMTSTTGTNDQLYETVNEELEIDRVKSEGEEAESLSEINIEDVRLIFSFAMFCSIWLLNN